MIFYMKLLRLNWNKKHFIILYNGLYVYKYTLTYSSIHLYGEYEETQRYTCTK